MAKIDKIIIFGATSAIAQETAKCFASDKAEILIVARDFVKLDIIRKDLEVRGARAVHCLASELSDVGLHQNLYAQIKELMPDFNCVLVAYGFLGQHDDAINNPKAVVEILNINFISVASLLTILAADFEKRQLGTLAVIGSVAGDRGRKSNYIYGSAKGGLELFLQGLRNRLFKSSVNVLTIKPGFVDTPMTAGFKKGILFASSSAVGRGIYKAIQRKKEVVYLPAFWILIMLIIKAIPEKIFKRLSI